MTGRSSEINKAKNSLLNLNWLGFANIKCGRGIFVIPHSNTSKLKRFNIFANFTQE